MAVAMMTISSMLLFDNNDAVIGGGGVGKGTVIVIAGGIAHGDGDDCEGIYRKANRKINADTHKLFNSESLKEKNK